MVRVHPRLITAAKRITLCMTVAYQFLGCLPSATEARGVTPLEGQWDISGQAASGSGGAFQGTWTVKSTTATAYAGSYDILESVTPGGQRRLTGPVSGRMANASTTEFDVLSSGSSRRHVGVLQGDTVRGNWFDVSQSGAVEASGTFRAVKR